MHHKCSICQTALLVSLQIKVLVTKKKKDFQVLHWHPSKTNLALSSLRKLCKTISILLCVLLYQHQQVRNPKHWAVAGKHHHCKNHTSKILLKADVTTDIHKTSVLSGSRFTLTSPSVVRIAGTKTLRREITVRANQFLPFMFIFLHYSFFPPSTSKKM